ncbi:Putative hydrolase, alpha/beta hydrolase fold [Mycobacteroides abscessus subsp. massiliense]|nr:Putative hydrolase, alpha/beta hydrolase fold [Mycobacteroides abscessus subsp. massiliense]
MAAHQQIYRPTSGNGGAMSLGLEKHRRSVDIERGRISYLDIGAGAPTVFVHGVLTNSLLWRDVVPAVAATGRRCIALDLPGHGHSPVPADDIDVTLSGLAQLIAEFLDSIGIDEFDLVANDTGGAVAQIMVARQPGRIRTLALTNCDTEGHVPPKLFKPVVALARPPLMALIGPRLFARRKVFRALLGAGYRKPGRLPDSIVESYGQPVFGTAESSRFLSKMLRAMHTRDLEAARAGLVTFTKPTLIAWGLGDYFFPLKYGQRLAELFGGPVTFETVPDGRLYFPDEDADRLLPLLYRHWHAAGLQESSTEMGS